MAGGALIVIGLAFTTYYTAQLLQGIQDQEKQDIEPGGSISITEEVVSGRGDGVYFVSFASGSEASLALEVVGQSDNRTLVSKTIESSPVDLPIVEPFGVPATGNYTLILSNPTDGVVQVSAGLGNSEAIASAQNLIISFVFMSLFIAGIGIAVVGGVITILDRRRISKMKQFGDTSDLV